MSRTTSTTNSIEYVTVDEWLENEIIMCKGKHIMLRTKIWIEACLVNGALGKITNIIYSPNSKPPELPLYVTTRVDNYNSLPCNIDEPKSYQ